MAFNFNFYKKNITTTQNYLSFLSGKSFLKQMLYHSLYEVSIRYGGTVFSYNDVGRRLEWEDKKKFRGDLPCMMPWDFEDEIKKRKLLL